MVVTQLHAALANTIILFMSVCGVWGLFRAFRGGLDGSLSGALVIGEGLILGQALLGIITFLISSAHRPADNLHYLYGISTIMTLPGIYSFTRGRPATIQALWYGAGAFFIVGLALRGITTGRVG